MCIRDRINTALTTAVQGGLAFDGIWTASTSFLDPIFDVMHSLEKDYVVTGIDISDTEVQMCIRDRRQVYGLPSLHWKILPTMRHIRSKHSAHRQMVQQKQELPQLPIMKENPQSSPSKCTIMSMTK